MSLMDVQGVGKVYRHFSSEWKRVGTWFGFPFKPIEETWVLRDVSFSIAKGEAVGVIGQNGAGKSTLLKIITGTLLPSKGSVAIHGRVSAILELGMGFNPDLTGRQNVYHSASIMGFGREQVDERMGDIEKFAEIGEYFDQPVRTYSSGMQVRVAFAVATAWRPDILIIDEALSVGDSYFQHKSFGRIREFQKQGTTLLIVSHDRGAIQALCDRAVLLENGEVIKDGAPEAVMDYYNALIAEKEGTEVQLTELDNGKIQTRSGTGEARVEAVELQNENHQKVETISVGERVRLVATVTVNKAVPTLVFGFGLKDRLGQVLFGINTWHTDQVIHDPEPGRSYRFVVEFEANFGIGNYSVQTALVDRDTHLSENYDWWDLALVFDVVNAHKPVFSGSVWMESTISIEESF